MQEITTVPQHAASLHRNVAGDLLHPQFARVNGDAGDVHPAALKVDEKQHVVGHRPAQRQHLRSKEVGPRQQRQVDSDEDRPRGRALAPRRGRQSMEAFRELDRTSQLLMRAEASTLAGLIAMLRYVAPLLQEAGAPGFPIEIPFAGRWSAAFGTFCADVANSLVAVVTAGSAATPERIDRIANAIVEATAPLIDDFEVARRAARVAIDAIAS